MFTDQSPGLVTGPNAGWEEKLNVVSLSLPLDIMPCSRRVPGDGHSTTLTAFLTPWCLREEREQGRGRGEHLDSIQLSWAWLPVH